MSGIILLSKRHRFKFGAFLFLISSAFPLMAQTTGSENVGIGTTKPDNSAILDLTSNSKGFLVPRMTLAQRGSIKSPANGLMVYQTDFFSGFYFFDGAAWKNLYARTTDGTTTEGTTVITNNVSNENSWNLSGNSGLNSNLHFIGTTDTSSLVLKVNNFRSGLIDYRFGNTYFGYRAGYRSQGFNSIAIGAYALHEANIGLNNIAIGYQSLPNNKTGSDNVAVGANALFSNITGSQNIAIGTQAGQKSIGNSNIFLGHSAGANETGNDKLYIDNGAITGPLLFGDFAAGRIGINTKSPESALSIDSKLTNTSGLEFKQLTNASPAGRPTQKVLSVDDKGRVILIRDSIGMGSSIPPAIQPTYWTAKGSAIENSNAGDVIVGNLRFKNLRSTSPASKSNLKVLSVDENGSLVLVKDSIGTSTGGGGQTNVVAGYWDLTDNIISNSNGGKVVLKGGVQFQNLTAYSNAYTPYGKVLTVDDNGNLLLVRDSVGTGSGGSSSWTVNGNAISNNNAGRVLINNGLAFSQFNSETPTAINSQKFLTVDNGGNVILANSPVAGTPAPNGWSLNGAALSNSNTGLVTINNGLNTKNGLKVESGGIEINGTALIKNGLTFSQFNSETPTAVNSQKFLTVDNTGNLILANSPVAGTPAPNGWSLNGAALTNSNTGLVTINNGLTTKNGLKVESGGVEINSTLPNKSGVVLTQLKSSSPASKSTGKVLSVDDSGNIILVKDSVAAATSGVPILPPATPSAWNVNDNNITNNNTGNVSINNGLILSKLSSESPTTVTTQKVLSVDANGKVILVSTPTTAGGGISEPALWKTNNNGIGITNSNNGGIAVNSNEDGKSGLQFSKLKSFSTAYNPYGKVLSVDDNGNIILVRDSVGTGGGGGSTGPSNWNLVDGRLQNANGGKVVIGTGINSYPDGFNLFVKGGILTERVRVALANSERWADYVFKKDYKLMPLKDVEKFIKHNQHLPNVPSAEEMSKNGLDVAETSAKLMEKIEELTLYLIEATKKIEALESKVNNLEKVQK